jgi:hypothetical protein
VDKTRDLRALSGLLAGVAASLMRPPVLGFFSLDGNHTDERVA